MEKQKPILDRAVIKSLVGDDPEVIKQFEMDFVMQAKQKLQSIKQLFNQGELTVIKEEAHFLKTSAKAVGAEQTAELLEVLEQAALDKQVAECKQLIISIFHSVQDVYKEMQQ